MKNFSNLINLIKPSESMVMAEKIKQLSSEHEILNLTWGQPDFDTPDHIKQAACTAINCGKNEYTASKGIIELRKAISGFVSKQSGAAYDPQQEILITPGVKQGLGYIMQAILDPGDEVVIPEPCWLSYQDIIFIGGGCPKFVPAKEGLVPDLEKMEKAITSKTKAILINNPVNPSGYVFTKEELQAVADMAIKNDCYVIADEIYDRIVFKEYSSLSEIDSLHDRLIVANGFSKIYAMTGWRIGYLLSTAEIISKISLIHQHTATCASSQSQYAALAAVEGKQEFVDNMKETYLRRRNLMTEGLKGSAFPLIVPDGTFYGMLDVSSLKVKPEQNSQKLLEKYGIASVNGISYGESARNYVRISMTIKDDKLKEVIDRLT